MVFAEKTKIVIVQKRFGARNGTDIAGNVFGNVGMAIDPSAFLITEHFLRFSLLNIGFEDDAISKKAEEAALQSPNLT